MMKVGGWIREIEHDRQSASGLWYDYAVFRCTWRRGTIHFCPPILKTCESRRKRWNAQWQSEFDERKDGRAGLRQPNRMGRRAHPRVRGNRWEEGTPLARHTDSAADDTGQENGQAAAHGVDLRTGRRSLRDSGFTRRSSQASGMVSQSGG